MGAAVACAKLWHAVLRRAATCCAANYPCRCLQFTSEHYLIEGAKEVVAAGGDSFKFNLANLDARGNAISVSGHML